MNMRVANVHYIESIILLGVLSTQCLRELTEKAGCFRNWVDTVLARTLFTPGEIKQPY